MRDKVPAQLAVFLIDQILSSLPVRPTEQPAETPSEAPQPSPVTPAPAPTEQPAEAPSEAPAVEPSGILVEFRALLTEQGAERVVATRRLATVPNQHEVIRIDGQSHRVNDRMWIIDSKTQETVCRVRLLRLGW